MRIIPPKVPPITKQLLLALLLTFTISSPAFAQVLESEDLTESIQESSPTATASASPMVSPSQTETVKSLETREIQGEIIKSTNDSIIVDTGSEKVELRLFDNIKITRDGKDITAAELQTGDQVKAVIDSNSNQAILVEATSAETNTMQQWLVPAAIAALLIIGLLYWLLKRANRQRIKTTTTSM